MQPSGLLLESGDSIGAGTGAGGYAAIDHLGFGNGVTLVNLSVNGRTMLIGYQVFTTVGAGYYSSSGPSVLLIEQGTNDLGASGWTADMLYETVAVPFVALARKAGFYVALNTVLPRADTAWNATKEAQRQRYNALVRANSAGADIINDTAADAQIGDNNPNWLSYYPDGLHPLVEGQQRLAVITAAALGPLFALPLRTPTS